MQSDKVSETIKGNICFDVLSKSGNNIFDSGMLSGGGTSSTPKYVRQIVLSICCNQNLYFLQPNFSALEKLFDADIYLQDLILY